MILITLISFFIFTPESDPGEHSFWKLITLPKVTLMAFAVSSVSSCFGFLDIILSLFVLEKVSTLTAEELCLEKLDVIACLWTLLCRKFSAWLQEGGRIRDTQVAVPPLCDIPITRGLIQCKMREASY